MLQQHMQFAPVVIVTTPDGSWAQAGMLLSELSEVCGKRMIQKTRCNSGQIYCMLCYQKNFLPINFGH